MELYPQLITPNKFVYLRVFEEYVAEFKHMNPYRGDKVWMLLLGGRDGKIIGGDMMAVRRVFDRDRMEFITVAYMDIIRYRISQYSYITYVCIYRSARSCANVVSSPFCK